MSRTLWSEIFGIGISLVNLDTHLCSEKKHGLATKFPPKFSGMFRRRQVFHRWRS